MARLTWVVRFKHEFIGDGAIDKDLVAVVALLKYQSPLPLIGFVETRLVKYVILIVCVVFTFNI